MRKLSLYHGLIDFASNDYLGFSKSKELKAKILQKMLAIESLGSTGSRLLTGNSQLVEDLESKIAHFFAAESALLFSSGYNANLGLFSTLLKRDDLIFFDKMAHASIRDGIVLSRAHAIGFEHNNLQSLHHLLKKASKRAYVAIESIYSVDGTVAPLKELCELCQLYEAKLIVDEAHATGVFGRGLVCQFHLQQKVWARIHTFSKALGVSGGALLINQEIKNHLINSCRPFIYTTAMPSYCLVAIDQALDHLQNTQEPEKLFKLMKYLEIKTPILALKVEDARNKAAFFRDHNLAVSALLPPTVPAETEVLRFCLHSFNTQEEIDTLCKLL